MPIHFPQQITQEAIGSGAANSAIAVVEQEQLACRTTAQATGPCPEMVAAATANRPGSLQAESSNRRLLILVLCSEQGLNNGCKDGDK